LATVVAVRHAQADRPTGVDDFDRCLFSLRGRSNAVETLEELVTAYAAEPPAFYAESCTTSVPTWLRLWAAVCFSSPVADRGHDVASGPLFELELLGDSFLLDGLARFLDGGVSWRLISHGSPCPARRQSAPGLPLVWW